eukprot:4254528-Alexandrium_andersonii.AAC.1
MQPCRASTAEPGMRRGRTGRELDVLGSGTLSRACGAFPSRSEAHHLDRQHSEPPTYRPQ